MLSLSFLPAHLLVIETQPAAVMIPCPMNKYARHEPHQAPPTLASHLGNADNSGKVSS